MSNSIRPAVHAHHDVRDIQQLCASQFINKSMCCIRNDDNKSNTYFAAHASPARFALPFECPKRSQSTICERIKFITCILFYSFFYLFIHFVCIQRLSPLSFSLSLSPLVMNFNKMRPNSVAWGLLRCLFETTLYFYYYYLAAVNSAICVRINQHVSLFSLNWIYA